MRFSGLKGKKPTDYEEGGWAEERAAGSEANFHRCCVVLDWFSKMMDKQLSVNESAAAAGKYMHGDDI